MPRLIDANALLKEYCKDCDESTQKACENDPFCCLISWVVDAPTLDAVEVVHGRWLKTENGIRKNINTGEMVMAYMHDCSVCGWHTGNQGRNFNYCPNCGAKMDGDSDA